MPSIAPLQVRAGLSAAEAARRLAAIGPNALPEPGRPSPWLLLARQLTHFFALLLWVAAALAVVAGMPQLGVAIAVVVVVNGVFAFAQEFRADRATERLRGMMPATASVRRDGHRVTVPSADLVPDDVVLLEAGDRVSADLVVVEGHGPAVDESMLTGESVPRHPGDGDPLYAGTFVVEGAATALVTATGPRTRMAGIAALTGRAQPPPSPLAVRLSRVVKIIAGTAIAVGVVFFGLSLALGMAPVAGFLLAIGVMVALVPEGLLPTVTLALAWGARRMAARRALVRRLEAVETLGSVTYICTDKTGTLTRNEMAVVEVWTPAGTATIDGEGYAPAGRITAAPAVRERVDELAYAAVRASSGRLSRKGGDWHPTGDPMEVALHVLALRAGVDVAAREAAEPATATYPFDSRRLRYSTAAGDTLYVKGAPETVLARCTSPGPDAARVAHVLAARGLRVLAVAERRHAALGAGADADERDLRLLGLVGLADPPRADVAEAIAACHGAGIRIAVITGDHALTAAAVAEQVGIGAGRPLLTLEGRDLPAGDEELGALLDRDGVVVARVTPEDKLRITTALQARGHVVAMTGDGVNDAPALRRADVGVAMGATGSDVAREAADLVLLDDHFGTIVAAVELGRATYTNIRRFLTYHLTDNVAELAPFVLWALTGGSFPLAIGVLQVLALDIGTDLLPALALGAEPPNPRTLKGPAPTGQLIDRGVVVRAFGVLGPTEVLVSLGAFTAVLVAGGWRWGAEPGAALLGTASGAAFAAIVLGQLANAFACRSASRPVWRQRLLGNRLLLAAVAVELALLVAFLAVPPVAGLLGGTLPTALGWAAAVLVVPAVVLADAAAKRSVLTRHR
ncbi:cation-translocating P-type ATPase [Spirilliplanes yamanashiensis]|uniref:Magnesium-transporting ATPase n=1 Tax=Spirilliplanes yamanashiensis TaxID=42233 RepID=A0A8J3YDI5_9ACTN|nr:cation-transporting P-type ATPase [Spirilliplanes yamanashiensis]MDP9818217.1 magnesium-transporting ATPase (P-type) [Spirilliplanes yamanashiensis]GIJ06756.1 magnesium-transporting ATPase [Spirilliplanes yamanashiensis]